MRLLALSLALTACGPPPPARPDQAPSAVVAPLVLGGGDDGAPMVPFTDGQDVTLVEGAQGGFHVWVRYRYAGDATGSARLERSAHRGVDDAIVLRSTTEVGLVAESSPMPMFMCPSPVGLSVIDQPIVFSLRFTSDDGAALAEGSVTLVPHCPDENRAFCLQICTG